MFTYDKEIDVEVIERLALDRDLTNHEIGVLVRMLTIRPKTANHARAIGVTPTSIYNLVYAGWGHIRAVYRERERFGTLAWEHDEVHILAKKDNKLSVFLITFSQKQSKTTHHVMISAHDEVEAIEKWRFAWPNHVARNVRNLESIDRDRFNIEMQRWLLPAGAISLPLRIQARKKRRYKELSDEEFFEVSQLTGDEE